MSQENIIYTKPTCPYCIQAKSLLKEQNIPFTEIQIQNDPSLREEMIEKSGRTTVPQIFFGSKHVGGCDDLYALHDAGKLKTSLA